MLMLAIVCMAVEFAGLFSDTPRGTQETCQHRVNPSPSGRIPRDFKHGPERMERSRVPLCLRTLQVCSSGLK